VAAAPKTVIDLSRLSLRSGEGKRLELPVELEPFELGGQTYVADPRAPLVRLDVSRQSGGYAFHLAFSVPSDGLCRFPRELERVVPTDPLPVVRFNRRRNGRRSFLVDANIRF